MQYFFLFVSFLFIACVEKLYIAAQPNILLRNNLMDRFERLFSFYFGTFSFKKKMFSHFSFLLHIFFLLSRLFQLECVLTNIILR